MKGQYCGLLSVLLKYKEISGASQSYSVDGGRDEAFRCQYGSNLLQFYISYIYTPDCKSFLVVVSYYMILYLHPTILWWRGTVVERRSLTGELSLSCARPAADG